MAVPVLNEKYARQIACDWDTKDEASRYVGYVTRLDEFNANIVGLIEIVSEFWSQD